MVCESSFFIMVFHEQAQLGFRAWPERRLDLWHRYIQGMDQGLIKFRAPLDSGLGPKSGDAQSTAGSRAFVAGWLKIARG